MEEFKEIKAFAVKMAAAVGEIQMDSFRSPRAIRRYIRAV